MIDVIVSEAGSLVVAHDEEGLASATTLDISADGSARLIGDGLDRAIGTLVPSMLAAVKDGMPAAIVRTAGYSIRKARRLRVRYRTHF
jgi:hypothetical protein